ncbi:MAG: hypothetical protein AAGI53_07740 [Planctomycetota bacterium]
MSESTGQGPGPNPDREDWGLIEPKPVPRPFDQHGEPPGGPTGGPLGDGRDRPVRVSSESETMYGWAYEVRITRRDGGESLHAVTLTWSDQDDLSGGSASPSTLVEAVVGALIESDPDRALPERFDVSTVRRWVPDLAERLRLPGLG